MLLPYLDYHGDLAPEEHGLGDVGSNAENELGGEDPRGCAIEYDPRMGIAYTRPWGDTWPSTEEIDELGLGPVGEGR